jgi:hypothetical protein
VIFPPDYRKIAIGLLQIHFEVARGMIVMVYATVFPHQASPVPSAS